MNRYSRFHRSAGISDDCKLSSSPGGGGGDGGIMGSAPPLAYPNPRLPPYPIPTIVQPMVQIHQHTLIPPTSKPSTARSRPTSGDDNQINKVLAYWGTPRYQNSYPLQITTERPTPRCTQALFIIGSNGNLMEYALDPHPESGRVSNSY